jgi:hypothetical protein
MLARPWEMSLITDQQADNRALSESPLSSTLYIVPVCTACFSCGFTPVKHLAVALYMFEGNSTNGRTPAELGLLFELKQVAARLSYSGLVVGADIAGVVDLKIWWPSQCNLRNLDEYRCCQTPNNVPLVVKAVHSVHPPPAQGHSRHRKVTSLPW